MQSFWLFPSQVTSNICIAIILPSDRKNEHTSFLVLKIYQLVNYCCQITENPFPYSEEKLNISAQV